jgi:hypothetical protein
MSKIQKMPFSYTAFDCLPLLIDNEIEIPNEKLLSEYVGQLILGHYVHVRTIIFALTSPKPSVNKSALDFAIKKLDGKGKTSKQIEKRDGWIFQMISWLALVNEKKSLDFYCQAPHDAPAKHGLDGIAVILGKTRKIENIIITEDKCTAGNQRTLIPKILTEFGQFEKGENDNKLVTCISSILDNLDSGKILAANQNNIYKPELRQYRIGMNRAAAHQSKKDRSALFKGFDESVRGATPHRRFASTFYHDDIRSWMEQFSKQIISYLQSTKP